MIVKSLVIAGLAFAAAFVSSNEAQAGCNRGNFYCEAQGQRMDGRWVSGQSSTVACAGTQGVNIAGIMQNLCHEALVQCVNQFGNPRIGERRCQVTQAYYANNNGHFRQGQFIGRRLFGH